MNPNAMRQQQRNNSNSPHQDEKRNRHIPLLSGATKHGVMINNSGHNATGISARPSVAVAVARNGVGLGTGAVDRRSSVSRNSTSLCPLSPLKPSINSSMRSISSNHQEDNDDQDED